MYFKIKISISEDKIRYEKASLKVIQNCFVTSLEMGISRTDFSKHVYMNIPLYIYCFTGSITIEGIALASVQATLPVWMYQTMNSDALEQGGLLFEKLNVR